MDARILSWGATMPDSGDIMINMTRGKYLIPTNRVNWGLLPCLSKTRFIVPGARESPQRTLVRTGRIPNYHERNGDTGYLAVWIYSAERSYSPGSGADYYSGDSTERHG